MDEILEKLEDLSITDKPKMPKGKRTAYMCFMKHTSSEMKKKGETYSSLGKFSKICSKKWKEISIKEKEKFQQMADEDSNRFHREMAKYEEAKNKYDNFIDEVHDKGFLNELDDEQKIADLSHCYSANKSVHSSRTERDGSSDGQTSSDSPANDTLELLHNKRKLQIGLTDKNSNKHKDDDEEEEEDEEGDEEDEEQTEEEDDTEEKEEEDEEDDEEEDEEETEEESDGEEDDDDEGDNEEESEEEEESDHKDNQRKLRKPGRRLF